MNKIYKVIWSKVKHQYVVTSEFAHSCTKSTTSRVGKGALAALAAFVLTAGVGGVQAASEEDLPLEDDTHVTLTTENVQNVLANEDLTLDNITANSGSIAGVGFNNHTVTATNLNSTTLQVSGGSVLEGYLQVKNKTQLRDLKVGGANGVANATISEDGKVTAKSAEVGGVTFENQKMTVDGQEVDLAKVADTSVTAQENADKLAAYEAAGIVAGDIKSSSRSDSIAIGTGAKILERSANSTVLGDDAAIHKYAENATAIGQGATVGTHAAGSTAIGQNSQVSSGITNAVALGHNSVAYESDTVSVGDSKQGLYRRVTNVADGKNPNDAVNVQQLNAKTAGMVQWDPELDDEGNPTGEYTNDIHGVTLENGAITADSASIGNILMNNDQILINGTTSLSKDGLVMNDGNGNAVYLGGGQLMVSGNIQAGSGTIGNVEIANGLVDGVDVSKLDTAVGDLDKNAVKWDDENKNSIHGVGLENGKVTADSASIGNILMNNDQILIDGTTSLSKDGLVINDGNGNSVYLGGGQLMVSGNIQAGSGTIGNVKIANGLVDGVDVSELAGNVSALDQNAVKWDDENHNSINGVGLADGNVTADKVTTGELDVNGNADISGNLTVGGSLTVGGETVATGADVSGIKEQIGVNEDGSYKTINNGASDVITGINNNTTAIEEVNKTVGSGKLDNGAADLTSGINQNYAQIQQNSQAINPLGHQVSDLGDEIDSVGAISAALAGLHPLDYDGTGSKFQISAAMGTYDGTQAAAIGGFYHFNRDVMMSLGGATSFEGSKKTAANIGVTFRVGEGASGKSVSDDVMARLEAMDQKIAALEQENKELKNVLGAIDTSLSKEFPDVPANHWAYEAVTKLAGNDVVAGYPDGEFHGDRTMTRYEMAEIIYKAMSKGVQVDQKLVEEFKPEMEQVAANTEGAETTPAAAAETAQPAEENA